MSKCEHIDYDDYFERCGDCGAGLEVIQKELIEQGGCPLCGAIPMTANCNNGGCDES